MLTFIPKLVEKLIAKIQNSVKRDSIRIPRLTMVSGIVSILFVGYILPYGGLLGSTSDTNQTTVKLDTKSPLVLTEPDQTVNIPVGMSRYALAQKGLAYDPQEIKLAIQEIAPEYGIDWKFVYAIGWIESGYNSSLARRNYNFFGRKAGRGVYARWSDPESAIRDQFSYLKTHYFDRGLDSPYEIGPIYCEGNTWAGKVTSVMNTL